MLNTDGISVFKSFNVSLWPIYLQINELPFYKRNLKEITVLCELWFVEEKPNMLDFLQPITDSLKTIYSQGIEVTSPDIAILH